MFHIIIAPAHFHFLDFQPFPKDSIIIIFFRICSCCKCQLFLPEQISNGERRGYFWINLFSFEFSMGWRCTDSIFPLSASDEIDYYIRGSSRRRSVSLELLLSLSALYLEEEQVTSFVLMYYIGDGILKSV